MPEIKYSNIEKAMHEVVAEASKNNRYSFMMYQECKTQGVVKRTAIDLCLCNDSECLSCSSGTSRGQNNDQTPFSLILFINKSGIHKL